MMPVKRGTALLLVGLCLPVLAETSHTTRTSTQTSTQGNQTHTQTYTQTTTRTSGQANPSFVRPAAQPDPISKLVQQLDADGSGLWINGLFPTIRLPAAASATAVLTEAIKLTGFSQGHIKSWKLLQVRQVRFRSQTAGYSAALIDSDLGRKILLFRYQSPGTGWWSRFYPAGQP